MPSTTFERDAITGFLNQLTAETGAEVGPVSHPEDDPRNPLTVDALVEVDGESWAIDHMRLVYERTVIPSADDAHRRLRESLREVARRHGRSLNVAVLPPRRHCAMTGEQINAYYARIVAKAEESAASGQNWFDLDATTSVQVRDRQDAPNPPSVEIATWMAEDASIEAQVVAALQEPVREKVRGQLAAAKAAGSRVLLLIDQMQDPTRRQPALFLASPATVTHVVLGILGGTPDIVDSVWFRSTNGLVLEPDLRAARGPRRPPRELRTTDRSVTQEAVSVPVGYLRLGGPRGVGVVHVVAEMRVG
jgi:hypothetical protein